MIKDGITYIGKRRINTAEPNTQEKARNVLLRHPTYQSFLEAGGDTTQIIEILGRLFSSDPVAKLNTFRSAEDAYDWMSRIINLA
jgi:hypothetical protein